MSYQEIINVISDKNSDTNKLHTALFIIRIHIDYCLENNIDLYKDRLISKVLIFR